MAYKYKCKCGNIKTLQSKWRGINCPKCGGSMGFVGMKQTKKNKR